MSEPATTSTRLRGAAGWAMRRWARGPGAGARGHLVWVDQAGEVHDLGAYTPEGLATIAWSWRVAYRAAQGEDKRRLARVRSQAHALSLAIARHKA